MNRSRQFTFALVALAIIAQPLDVESQAVRGTLVLADSDLPLSFGTIELLDRELNVIASTLSDALGKFVLRSPRPGTFSLRGSHMNADELVASGVRLAVGDVIDVVLTLPLRPIELDPLTVSVPAEQRFLLSNGFYSRSVSTAGTFFTPDQIQLMRPDRPTDLLRQIPGVQLTPDPNNPSRHSIRFSRVGFAGYCRPKIVVDAVTMVGLDLDELPVEDVAAVEIYKSALETPMQFSGLNAACGTIVIWMGPRT
jgi:hypothetical protein